MITRAPRPTSNFYLLDKAISEDKRLGWAARNRFPYSVAMSSIYGKAITKNRLHK